MKEQHLCPIRHQALIGPNRIAILASSSISYGQLDELIEKTVVSLSQAGVTAGQRVGIISSNTAEYIILLWALLRIKAVGCLFSTRDTLNQVISLGDFVGCSIFFHAQKIFPPQDKKDKWNSLPDFNRYPRGKPTGGAEGKWILFRPQSEEIKPTGGAEGKWILFRPQGEGIKPTGGIDLSLSKVSSFQREPIFFDVDQEATILFTSGTTASGKAVLHTYGNHWYSAIGANMHLPLNVGDRWLVSLPIYHVGGLAILFRCFVSGATVVIPPAQADIGSILQKYRITHLSLVPTQLQRMLNDSTSALQNITSILLGGDRIPPTLIQEAHDANLPVYTTYGLTEMASQVATSAPGEEGLRTIRYRDIMLGNDKEILVRGKTLGKGYIRGGKIVSLRNKNSWFHTRDRGYIDDDGCLQVLGRKDTMFISGGENIYPEEIEHILLSLHGIAKAIIIPIENQEFGFRPVAFISPAKNLDIAFIQHYLENRLPHFKIPEAFLPWPAKIPTDITDKKSRRLLTKYRLQAPTSGFDFRSNT